MICHNAVEVTRILLYKLNGIFMCGSRWGLGKPLKFHAAVYGGGGCLQTVYDDIQYILKILSWKGPTFPENNGIGTFWLYAHLHVVSYMPIQFYLISCSGLRGFALIKTVYYDIWRIAEIPSLKGSKFQKEMKSEILAICTFTHCVLNTYMRIQEVS